LKTLRPAVLEKIPFVALSLISSVLTVLAQKAGGAVVTLESNPLSTRLLIAADSLVSYLRKMVLPTHMLPYYHYEYDASILSLKYLFAVLLVAGITVFSLVVARKQKMWLSVWGYYIFTLLPVLGIVQVGGTAMADRYTYLPSIGPFLMMGLGAAWVSVKIETSTWGRNAARFIIAAAIVLLASLSYSTYKQIGIWKNAFTLWSYVIEDEAGRDFTPYFNRGLAFFRTGEFDRAIEDFDKAIALRSFSSESYFNKAGALLQLGDLGNALANYDRAIALNPAYYEAYFIRGQVHDRMGRLEMAIEDFRKASLLRPSDSAAYVHLGIAYGKAGRLYEAVRSFDEATAANPGDPFVYYNRGHAYSLMGQYDRALEDLGTAIGMNAGLAGAYVDRGMIYLKTGSQERAFPDFQRACDLGNEEGCRILRAGARRP
jgi:tetratricopeptide (TPR) repeat protein